ncbi:ComEC/Rec2 family competence protein [Rhizohabitans arisaemae]|uniref:ComEC/Rec2 family competence protein n=1 Tax=Rhizohabitans arisaemae TaxID=2720610 RepID=UPI0024B0B100|nr:ComEC/Rec2 family competence protein [Rhizohabitans arisaemae]
MSPLALPALATWVTTFVLLFTELRTALVVAALAAVAAGVVALSPRGRVATGVLVCVAAASVAVGLRLHVVRDGPLTDLAAGGATAAVEVVLTDDPRPSKQGTRTVVKATAVRLDARLRLSAPVVLLASGPGWRGLLPSQRVRVIARVLPPGEGDLVAALLAVRGPPEVLSPPSPVQSVASALRAGLREAAGGLAPAERGLLPALVVGDTSTMVPEVEEDFTAAGLSHLTAVSGSNLAVIAGAAVAVTRFAGLPLPVRAVLAALAMVGFAVVARPSPSVLRALLMGLIAAAALGTGRRKDGLAALSATVLALLLFNPELARSYGFALSVFATGGILVLAPRWRDRLAVRLPILAAEALAVTAAAQVACTPILILMSGELSLAAIPANLLAAPAVAPATVLGFAAAIVAPVWTQGASWLAVPAGYALGWIVTVARTAAGVPGAVISWPAGAHGLILLGLLGGAAFLATRRRTVAVVVVCALVAYVGVRLLAAAWPPRGWVLVACDVGQGDALAAAAGPGSAVVVDAGPDPATVDRCLRRLGVRRVPILVLTHPHADHVDGVPGVRRGRTVGLTVISPLAPGPDRGWPARTAARWRLPGVTVDVSAPVPAVGVNNASVVVRLEWPHGSALLTGDVEAEAQRELVRRGVPRVDVLKVPHHGSADQDAAFLAATGARTALVSVGEDNDYGHPAEATTSRLRALGMRVFRTDEAGDLAVVVRSGVWTVVSRGR